MDTPNTHASDGVHRGVRGGRMVEVEVVGRREYGRGGGTWVVVAGGKLPPLRISHPLRNPLD